MLWVGWSVGRSVERRPWTWVSDLPSYPTEMDGTAADGSACCRQASRAVAVVQSTEGRGRREGRTKGCKAKFWGRHSHHRRRLSHTQTHSVSHSVGQSVRLADSGSRRSVRPNVLLLLLIRVATLLILYSYRVVMRKDHLFIRGRKDLQAIMDFDLYFWYILYFLDFGGRIKQT